MKTLKKGHKSKLADLTPVTQFEIYMQAEAPNVVFDASCFGTDEKSRLSDEQYFVFYNQKSSPEGAIQLYESEAGSSVHRFALALDALPPSIHKLVFTLSIDGEGVMHDLESGHWSLMVNGEEVARFPLSGQEFTDEKAIVVAEIYRKDEWRLAAVGQGFSGGLSALLKHFGGAEEESETTTSGELHIVSAPRKQRSLTLPLLGSSAPHPPLPLEFVDRMQTLSARVPILCSSLQTEEATKNAFVLPFLTALGFDIFNPLEVIPEFTADHGIKKGEKVDYAIKKDGKIIMLFECKHCGADLNVAHASQLFRYFAVTEARVSVLTNGVQYRFFSDLEAPNKMDDVPFLEVNMEHVSDAHLAELAKFTKPMFNIDELLSGAKDLKYIRAIQRLMDDQLETPSTEFVKFIATQVFSGTLTPARREQFRKLTQVALQGFINEAVNERLQTALTLPEATSASPESSANTPKAIGTEASATNEDEWQGYFIIKAILRQHVEPRRIIAREKQSYFNILLDDNNRKPLARLYFNRGQMQIGLFNESRQEHKVTIDDLNDIYSYANELKKVLTFYEK